MFDLRGAVMTEDLLGQMNRMVSAGQARAVAGGASAAIEYQAQLRKRTL
jgi:hypothetical protein